jgi:hypothetical protein
MIDALVGPGLLHGGVAITSSLVAATAGPTLPRTVDCADSFLAANGIPTARSTGTVMQPMSYGFPMPIKCGQERTQGAGAFACRQKSL